MYHGFFSCFCLVFKVFLVWNGFRCTEELQRQYGVPTCPHPASPAVNILRLNIQDICQKQEVDNGPVLSLKDRLYILYCFSTHALLLCPGPKQDPTQHWDVTPPSTCAAPPAQRPRHFRRVLARYSQSIPQLQFLGCFLTIWLRLRICREYPSKCVT